VKLREKMALILSKQELARIKNSVQEFPEDRSQQERRAELKKKSDERLKHWPNTLEALRKKKENFIKERAEQEEMKRQEIDKQVRDILTFFFSRIGFHLFPSITGSRTSKKFSFRSHQES
jgi:hypothetical protein